MKLPLWLLNLWDSVRFHFMSIEAIDHELDEDLERLMHEPRLPLEIKQALVDVKTVLDEAERSAHGKRKRKVTVRELRPDERAWVAENMEEVGRRNLQAVEEMMREDAEAESE